MSKQVSLLNELFNSKLELCSDMEEYISRFTSLTTRMASIKFVVESELLVVLLLRGLTEEFRPFIMALETVNTNLTLTTVKEKLIQEGHRRKLEPRNGGVTIGTKHHGSSGGSQKKDDKNKATFDPKKARCFKCKEVGHIKAQCPGNKSGEGGKKKEDSNSCPYSKKTTWLTTLACEMSANEWYVDSGCNSHMTRGLSYFSDIGNSGEKVSQCCK